MYACVILETYNKTSVLSTSPGRIHSGTGRALSSKNGPSTMFSLYLTCWLQGMGRSSSAAASGPVSPGLRRLLWRIVSRAQCAGGLCTNSSSMGSPATRGLDRLSSISICRCDVTWMKFEKFCQSGRTSRIKAGLQN